MTISNVAMMALSWFAGLTGSFGDALDRAPEYALVQQLMDTGLLRPSGESYEPTPKGDRLLADIEAAKKLARPSHAPAWLLENAVAFKVQELPTIKGKDYQRGGRPYTIRGYTRVEVIFLYGYGTSRTTWSYGDNCQDLRFASPAEARAHVRRTFGAIEDRTS